MGTRPPFRWLASEIRKTMPSSLLLRPIAMRTLLIKLAGEMSVPININFFIASKLPSVRPADAQSPRANGKNKNVVPPADKTGKGVIARDPRVEICPPVR